MKIPLLFLPFVFAFTLHAEELTGSFRTLTGEATTEGNPVGEDGRIRVIKKPVIRIFPSSLEKPKGNILLFPGGGYAILSAIKEGEKTARFLSEIGYDVAILEYHVAAGDQTRDLALADALEAFRMMKSKPATYGLRGTRSGIIGYSAGAHLAARTAQNLKPEELPDDLMLIYPAYLDERAKDGKSPAITPPTAKLGRLFVLIAADDNQKWVTSCESYAKAWKEAGGESEFHLLPNGGHGFGMLENLPGAAKTWPDLLKTFLTQQ
ncbi:MAG: alpha/beta hydrolase [Verrucomicrobiota bacterium]